VLRLAFVLKKRNKNYQEKIIELSADLKKRLNFPVIDADDFAVVQSEIRNYGIIEVCIIIAEAFFNFFAARAIFNFEGWLAIAGQIFFALVVTWVSIPLFRNFFAELVHERPYKAVNHEPRNMSKLLILLLPLSIAYEIGMYSLCKLRGEQIEGGNSGIITIMMIIIGMLLPVLAGYFAYERRRYYSPYINTLRIKNLERRIAKLNNLIQVNLQKMETHFKQKVSQEWALLQEFKTYKENYNLKNNIPVESLGGHFAETQHSFINEAIKRYNKEALQHKNPEESTPVKYNWPQLQAAQFNSLNL